MEDKKLTDKEIKKALEVCKSEDLDCQDCLLQSEYPNCNPVSLALDYINCLEAEKESLQTKLSNCEFLKKELEIDNKNLKAEIEQYKADKEEYIKDYENLENSLKYSKEERKFEHQRVLNLQAENERIKMEKHVSMSVFTEIKKEFLNQVSIEENKYPYSDREKIFIDTIVSLLTALEHVR